MKDSVIPNDTRAQRRAFDFRDFRAAGGTWKRFVREPREELLILRRLVGRFRAAPPSVLFRLFRPQFPDVLFWKVLEFWRSERDA